MPRAKRVARTEEPAAEAAPEARGVRGLWSGNLSFGLVSLPVSLVTAQRPGRIPLHMLAPDGTRLKRRFFTSDHERALDDDDLVRGYEVDEGHFVVVTDDELAALAPKMSQEIDLRRFVPIGEIDPLLFERGYYLVPGKGSGKAYRLLARIMEERARAGIATFVMRGKEYLVAIIARAGILRAETLRFADEIRSVEDIGIDKPGKVDEKAVREFERRIDELREDELDMNALEDRHAQRLLALIEKKRRAGKDVIAAPQEAEEEHTGADVVDLLKYLKESLAGGEPARAGARERKRPRAATRRAPTSAKRRKRRRRAPA